MRILNITSLTSAPMALVLFLALCFGLSCYGVEGSTSISKEEMGTPPLALNKPASFKNIQPRNTDEYDCVDINKQPAFDHPLLKNHKIQLSTSFQSKPMENKASTVDKVSEIGFNYEGCPPGSVPIHRNFLDHRNIHPLTVAHPGLHLATLDMPKNGTAHYGARAKMSLLNPPVEMNQFSMAQIWIFNGPSEADLNSIQFGWGVHPRIYGDNRTRLTAYWTVDNYHKTGCYNAVCPGFVQVDPRYFLGAAFEKTSIYKGEQFITDLMIIQDNPSGNWWLIFNSTTKIGYWPKEIFTHLVDGASELRFGGSTFNSPDGKSPEMGFGLWPDDHFDTAGYFSQIQVVNDPKIFTLVDVDKSSVRRFLDAPDCYDLRYWQYQGEHMRETFTYGGPGGDCGS